MQYNSEKLDIKVLIRGNGLLFKAIKISLGLLIAVITVEPAGKASFVLGCIQTRLMGQYNGK